jgi:hypothetical protein
VQPAGREFLGSVPDIDDDTLVITMRIRLVHAVIAGVDGT